jgi:glucokinase
MTPSDRSQAACAIGIDVGGTKIAAGVIQLPEGRVLVSCRQPTRPERGGPAVLADVVTLVKSLQHEALGLRVEPISIGLGVAELVGIDGQVLSSATINWKGTPVCDSLQTATGLPVAIDADVRAAARAEADLGAGRQFDSFLYVSIGTGISSSLVIHGRPYVGARGLTGTFGSSGGTIPAGDDTLISGPPLEEFASGPALASRLRAARAGFSGSAPEVIAFAENGDAIAQRIVASAGEALGAAIAHLVNVLDPEAVILGGGLGLAAGKYRNSLESALRAHIWSDIHRPLPLLSAQLGADAGVIGAAIFSLDR